MTDARREDYWSEIEDAPNVRDLIRSKAESDDWSVHALILAGEDDGTRFVLVVRSAVRDSGLILSERYMTVPDDVERESDLTWSSNGIERRIGGDLPTALLRSYARVSNDRLAANDLADPVCFDATGADLGEQPDKLLAPISPDRAKTVAASESNGTVECELCGQPVEREDAVNVGGALGVDHWTHKGECPTEGDE